VPRSGRWPFSNGDTRSWLLEVLWLSLAVVPPGTVDDGLTPSPEQVLATSRAGEADARAHGRRVEVVQVSSPRTVGLFARS
jgi:hypothetical protein